MKLKHFKIAKNSYHLRNILKNNKFFSEELKNLEKSKKIKEINNSRYYLKTLSTEKNKKEFFLKSFSRKKMNKESQKNQKKFSKRKQDKISLKKIQNLKTDVFKTLYNRNGLNSYDLLKKYKNLKNVITDNELDWSTINKMNFEELNLIFKTNVNEKIVYTNNDKISGKDCGTVDFREIKNIFGNRKSDMNFQFKKKKNFFHKEIIDKIYK